jgi:hypothetical protein
MSRTKEGVPVDALAETITEAVMQGLLSRHVNRHELLAVARAALRDAATPRVPQPDSVHLSGAQGDVSGAAASESGSLTAGFNFYWLVELRPAFAGHPGFEATYYAGYMDGPEAAKTRDPNAAPKWERKVDAEAVASKIGHTLSCVWEAVEHGFAR